LYLHGFRSMPVGDLLADRIIQSYFVHSVKYSKKGRRFPMKFGAITVETDRSVTLSDQYEIFPTSQLGGHCLAILLEPTSKYGLRRSMNFGLSTLSDGYYQILRIL
jgi:hypothetical protein